jgi:hypothetical protein
VACSQAEVREVGLILGQGVDLVEQPVDLLDDLR